MKRTTTTTSGPKSIILNRGNILRKTSQQSSISLSSNQSTTTRTSTSSSTPIRKQAKKSPISLEFAPCVDFVLSILNHYELNYGLDSSDILSVLSNDLDDYGRLHQIIRSLYITIYNTLIFYKFNKVSLNNEKHDLEKIIKYVNYELLRLEYSRVFKLITKNDELLCIELLHTLNWLILSHNPLLFKHILNMDYLNQNLINGELPSDHSLYYFLKNAKNTSNALNEKFSTIQLIHKLIINVNKIFMIMSNLYNKTMQSYLLNMECENIGFTPFELNLLLLNDHSSQLYQLNNFIGSFNSILKYYELLIYHSTFKSFSSTRTTMNSSDQAADKFNDNDDNDSAPMDSFTIELLLSQLETSTESSNSLIDEFIEACEIEPIPSMLRKSPTEGYHAPTETSHSSSGDSSSILDSVFYRLRMEKEDPNKKKPSFTSFLSGQKTQSTPSSTIVHHLVDLESMKELLLNAIHQEHQ